MEASHTPRFVVQDWSLETLDGGEITIPKDADSALEEEIKSGSELIPTKEKDM